MSVTAFPQADADFESFIDEDAVGDCSSTPSDAATTSFTSSVESGIHQTMSLPNTPKLASGLHLSQPMSSSLHNLSFDWEDDQHHRGSLDTSSLGASHHQAAWRKPLDDSFTLPSHSSAHHHGSMHQRSMSLSMHDVAPQFLDDLRAQAPAPMPAPMPMSMPALAPEAAAPAPFFPVYPHQPFIKMEPDTYGTAFPAMSETMAADMAPVAAPVPASMPMPVSGPVPAPAPAADATAMETDNTTPPQEKKRKLDGASKPKKARKKSSAAAAAAAATATAAAAAAPPSTSTEEAAPTAPAAPDADGQTQSAQEGSTAATTPQKEGQEEAASTTEDAAAADGSKDNSASSSSAAAGGEEGSPAPSASSPRKPAAKSKKPPPSASQVTESGKPFPVIDTSATHSSLFIPPDTSGLTKREARLVKNRAAAFLSRQRKREQFELLEKQCKSICRLTWKMWEQVAGAEAGVDRIDESSIATLLADESPDVRDCLEQIINNQGASIAPTEESIANGTHSTAATGDSSRQKADSRMSPAASVKSAGSKRERDDESGSSTSAQEQQATIDQLRAQLQAAEQRETSLQAALVEARAHPPVPFGPAPYPGMGPPPPPTHAMSSFHPPPHDGPHHHHHPHDAFYYPWAANHPQQRVFRDSSSLSLTVAPQMSARDVDMVSTPTMDRPEHSMQRSASVSGTSSGPAAASSSGSSSAPPTATASAKKSTSSMALMALIFGFALFGSGGVGSQDAPRMGITRLGPMSGSNASIGSLFDPIASSSTAASNPIAGLFGRRRRKNNANTNGLSLATGGDGEDEEMTALDGSGAPSSHLSPDDLALSTEHHLHNMASQMLEDVTDMLPQCSLDDSAAAMSGRDAKRPTLRRMQSDSSLLLSRHKGATAGSSSWNKSNAASSSSNANSNSVTAAAAEHLQQGLILLGEHHADGMSSMDGDGHDAAPRKLKLFLRRRALSDVATQQQQKAGTASAARGATCPNSPTAGGTAGSDHDDDDDIFEDADAGTRTPTSAGSHSRDRSGASDVISSASAFPSGRVAPYHGSSSSSYMELEFSLSSKRVVKDEQELAALIQQAAQRAAIGGGAAFAS